MPLTSLSMLTLSDVRVAVYVPTNTGSLHHVDRPFHGIVFNEEDAWRDYTFSDGTVLKTEPFDVFYLPRASTYQVAYPFKTKGGCFAVNFDAVEDDTFEPFKLRVRDTDAVLRLFKKLCAAYDSAFTDRRATLFSLVYALIALLLRESNRAYVPHSLSAKLMPADTIIRARFADASLSVTELAAACGVSDTYYRRLFKTVHGVTPLKYITSLRMNRACELLSDGSLSVERTALLCGYTDAGYFSREFDKLNGLTAGAYKRSRGVRE